ncbi:MAG: TonB-dependent receptor [Bacteroidota bacterium]
MKNLFTIAGLLLLTIYSHGQDQDSIKNYDIDEVQVMATRLNTQLKSIPQKVEIIDETVIRSIPSGNMAELLKNSTNIDIVQYPGLSSSIGIRGFSPSSHSGNYNLILINGTPAGTQNLSSIDTKQFERIEVVKGPYSVLYGSDAMGGVINLITRKDKETGGSVGFGLGSFGNYNLNARASVALSDRTAINLGYTRKEQMKDYRIGRNNLLPVSSVQWRMLDSASYGDTMQNTTFRINHLNGGVTHQINESWTVAAEALYTLAGDVETPGNYWGSYGQSKRDIGRLNLYGTISRRNGSNLLTISPYYTDEHNAEYTNNSDTGFVDFDSRVREYGVKMHDQITLGDFNLLVGGDFDVYDYNSERFMEAGTPTAPYAPDHQNSKAALFSQLSYAVGGFSANAGLRFDHITYSIEKNDSLNGTGGREAYNALTTSLGAQYRLPFGLKLHGSYGTAYTVPDGFKVAGYYSVSEYFPAWNYWWVQSFVGNQELQPESSATYDLGIGYTSPNRLVSADVTWFNTVHQDKIVDYYIGVDTISYKNANQARMSGLEVMWTIDLGVLFSNRFKLEFYENITQMFRSEMDETVTGLSGNDSLVTREMLYVRKNNGNFGIHFDNYNGFSTRLHFRDVGSRLERDFFSYLRPDISQDDYYTEGGWTSADMILQHPRHFLLDYSAAYTFQNQMTFGITISNLFNENYTEMDGYNMPGRMFTGSFSYTF